MQNAQTKLSRLAEDGFMDKLCALFDSINDIAQGEEIVELLAVFYRRIFKQTGVEIYALDAAKKVRSADAAQGGHPAGHGRPVGAARGRAFQDRGAAGRQSRRSLSSPQSHSTDILETLLCTDVLLYCLEVTDSSMVNSELVQSLLGIILITSDNNILNLIAHLIHLHCSFHSNPPLIRRKASLQG